MSSSDSSSIHNAEFMFSEKSGKSVTPHTPVKPSTLKEVKGVSVLSSKIIKSASKKNRAGEEGITADTGFMVLLSPGLPEWMLWSQRYIRLSQ